MFINFVVFIFIFTSMFHEKRTVKYQLSVCASYAWKYLCLGVCLVLDNKIRLDAKNVYSSTFFKMFLAP